MFIRDIEIKNFKVFKYLENIKFTRVNLIGGKNSTGKSSLLEALFLLVDSNNPAAIARHAALRAFVGWENNSELSVKSAINNPKEPVIIKANTAFGLIEYTLNKLDSNQITGGSGYSTIDISREIGSISNLGVRDIYSLVVKINNIDMLNCNLSFQGGGISLQLQNQVPYTFPTSVFLTGNLYVNSGDFNQRFSRSRETGFHLEILKELSRFNISATDMFLLDRGGSTSLHLETSDKKIVPLAFFGSGVNIAVAILLAVHDAKNGVVFIDEFDGSIHYSILRDVWKTFFTYAVRYDCQIVAATHSFESIRACKEAAQDLGLEEQLTYHRLLLDPKHSRVIASNYGSTQLSAALEQDAEVR